MLDLWNKFKKDHKESKDVKFEDFEKFRKDYSKKYDEIISGRVDESFFTERELMEDIFGSLYEEESEEHEDSPDTEEGDDDGGSEETDGGGSGGGSGGGNADTKNLFIVPMKELNVAFKDNRY